MENREKIRDRLQESFDRAFENEDINSLHELYSKLRKMGRSVISAESECVDISDLCENICIASDILLRESGKTVVFCGNDVTPVWGNRQILTKAVLEALGNACVFGSGSLITVKTSEHKDFVSAEIQSAGSFIFRNGDGLDFIRNTVKRFGGEMLIISENAHSSTVMTFKKSANLMPSPNTCFIDLVTDRLSPVFVELYGM